jgi:hypothetical protein
MPSLPPPSDEPLSRGIGLHGFRAAVIDLWGQDGVAAVAARLPEDTRRKTIDDIVLPVSWYPERFTIDWQEAVLDGPAQKDDAAFFAFIDRGIEQGFGRMRRFFLRLASLEAMVARGPEAWRYQHTHGTMTAKLLDRRRSIYTLRDHPFVRHPLTRRSTAAAWRHIGELAGLKDMKETHAMEGGETLVVHLSFGGKSLRFT